MGGGRSGGLSLVGRLEGSSRSKSPGCCSMGSSGDLSSGVYCGGGPVSRKTTVTHHGLFNDTRVKKKKIIVVIFQEINVLLFKQL